MQSESSTYDMVVIGCGAAGLSAAVSCAAAKPGARIAVLERADREGRGGATRWTSSWFAITEDRRLEPEFADRMERFSNGMTDLEVCHTLMREVPDTIAFLESHGVEVIYFKQPFPNRNTGSGLGMPKGGGVDIVNALARVVDETPGAKIFYDTEAVRLSLTDGRIDGVIVRGKDGVMKKIASRAVVIACGGFEGSKEMLTQYLGPGASDLPLVAPTLKNNRGDGVRMAMEVGADTAGQFDMFHGEPMDPRSSKPDAVVYAFPFGIVVNEKGERFFDEGKDSFDSTFEEFSVEIWKNQNQRAWFIGDQTTLSVVPVQAIILTDQPPVTANAIGELAGKLGIDAPGLNFTIREYNDAVIRAQRRARAKRGARAGQFDPHVRDGSRAHGLAVPKSNWAFPLNSPPYIAYPITCAICFTFGGVRTDASARVVTPNGTVIPGLYAAGEVVGLYYHRYPVGTSVLRAATFGRIAGAHAARLAT